MTRITQVELEWAERQRGITPIRNNFVRDFALCETCGEHGRDLMPQTLYMCTFCIVQDALDAMMRRPTYCLNDLPAHVNSLRHRWHLIIGRHPLPDA